MHAPRFLILLFVLVSAPVVTQADNATGWTVVYPASSEFEDVIENIKMAVTDRGLLVSGILHVSEMLNRTGPDLGFANEVFLKAESVEFCSALVSHRMVVADPSNLSICPFTVSAYVLTDVPDQVYVAYRRPHLAGSSDEAAQAAADLLDGIARDAAE